MRRRKVALHSSSHLTPSEAWHCAVSITSDGRRVSNEAWLENCTQVGGWAKLGKRTTHGWDKIALHTCSDLSKPVRTCPQYHDNVRWSRDVFFSTFGCSYSSVLRPILVQLHILTRLIESFPNGVRLIKRCIEVKLSIPLGAYAYRPSIALSAVIF